MQAKSDGPGEHTRYRKKQNYEGRSFNALQEERILMRERDRKSRKILQKEKKELPPEVDYSPIEELVEKYGLRSCFKRMSHGMSMKYLYKNGKIYRLRRTFKNRGKKIVIEKELLDLDYDKLEDK